MALSLDAYAGGSHTLEFEFISDAAGVAEGLYLDDIEVTGANVPFAESFGGVSLTNYTGYVIDADAFTNNVAFNRESLLVNTIVAAENFEPFTTNASYQFTYRLRATNGAQFPIFNFNNATNAALTYIATNTISVAASRQTNVTNFASLRPAARLSHLTEYKIEVEVARVGGAVLFRGTNGPFHFYHFTNTVSGDASFNSFAEFLDSGVERSWLIDTMAGSDSFEITNAVSFHRYDEFMAGASAANIPVRLDVELRNATTDALVPLVNSFSNYLVAVNNYTTPASTPPEPRERTNTLVLGIRPASQLNSVDSQYRVIVRMTYTNTLGQPGLALGSMTNGPQRFLHFNGNLLFGDIDTTFNSVNTAPTVGLATPGSHIVSSLFVSLGAGTING
ncbi:MAG TPA: hypothetical protein VK846_04335, partial [Candidatus Limnocylindria bacterium]|nr:hypothetical protein [Candidatus Limnocylindria bacterium]